MKKIFVFLLTTAVLASCGMLSHNADGIINDMRDARHAQYFNVGSGLLGLGRLISPTLAEAGLGITSVQLLDLSKCSHGVRDKFRRNIQNLYKNRDYEEIITTQQGYGEQRTVLVRRDGQYVSEIVVANAGGAKDMMVLIYGHINIENLERIINDQSNYIK